LVFAAALAGCGKKEEQAPAGAAKPAEQAKPVSGATPAAAAPAKPSGLPVKAVPVRVGAVQSDISAVGTLFAAESVVIRPEIAGRVTELHFQEGQAVPKGARLVAIDPSELQAQLASSTAQARTETQKYERAKELKDKSFISQEALDVAKGSMDGALARKRRDEVLLSKTEITAPFGGIVGLRQISPGAYVKAGDDIVRLESISSLKMDFRVPEVYLSKLRPGQEVDIKVDAYAAETFQGRIYALEPAVDEKTRTVVVRAQVPNGSGKLRPGMFARVQVLLETRPNAVLVPEQAIWPQGRDTFVYRVVDGKAALTKVDIGLRRPGEVEILKGLAANDTIVTDGQIKLKDGAPVMVLPSQPPAPSGQPAPAAGSAPKAG
jgi:membrane fusion protein (multidrug efflux system)